MVIKLGIDCCSGDKYDSLEKTQADWVEAASEAKKLRSELELILAGDENFLSTLVGDNDNEIKILPSDCYTDMSGDIRSILIGTDFDAKKDSLTQLYKMNKKGEIHGVVASNDTAVMILNAMKYLGRLKGYKGKIPLSIQLPTKRTIDEDIKTLFLDIGGNNELDDSGMVGILAVGLAYTKQIMNINNPSIGLLSTGKEESKGTKYLRKTNETLKKILFNYDYKGMVEPKELFGGDVSIVLADGYTGNLVLKTLEAVLNAAKEISKQVFNQYHHKIAYLLAKDGLNRFKKIISPESYNGTPFLGFNGLIFKAHGDSDVVSKTNAIVRAYDFINDGVSQRFNKDLVDRYKLLNDRYNQLGN